MQHIENIPAIWQQGSKNTMYSVHLVDHYTGIKICLQTQRMNPVIPNEFKWNIEMYKEHHYSYNKNDSYNQMHC